MEPEKKDETPVAPPAPVVDMKAIVEQANREAAETAKRIIQEKTTEIVANTRKEIAASLDGSKDEKTLNPNFVRLVNETDDVLGTVAQVAEERAYNRIKFEQKQERAVNEILGSREDLRTNEIAQMAVAGLTNRILQAQPDKDLKEAMLEAVKIYDSKAQKPEVVVPTQTTVPSAGGGGTPPAAGEKTVEELDREELLSLGASAAAKRRPLNARIQQ